MALFGGLGVLMFVCPDVAFAQFGGGGLESRIEGITKTEFITFVPAASRLVLSITRSWLRLEYRAAGQRMVVVAVTCAIGMMAPFIIRWLQGMAMWTEMKTSQVHRRLDAKLKVGGVEAADLVVVLFWPIIQIVFLGECLTVPASIFGIPLLLFVGLYFGRRGKPDGFLIHAIKFFFYSVN